MGKEFEYVMSISETLESGKWIAVINKDIIKGDSAKDVFKKARDKYPKKEPFVMKVPDSATMLM